MKPICMNSLSLVFEAPQTNRRTHKETPAYLDATAHPGKPNLS